MSARRLVLITGASAGIGAAFARAYAARGWDVALTARRAERLEQLAQELRDRYKVEAFAIASDLADAAAPEALLAALQEKAGRAPDGLVNNAGYGLPGAYVKTSWEEQAAFLQVMATAPAALTHAVLPGMQARGFGRIIQVASLAGILPGAAGHTLYAPVKAFLIKFAQSLNMECEGTGVHVSALCPGFTYSEFHDVTGTRAQVSAMPRWMWSDARDVAREGYAAVMAGRPVVVTGRVNRAIAFGVKHLPAVVADAAVHRSARNFRKL